MKTIIGMAAAILFLGHAWGGEKKIDCNDPEGGYEETACANGKYKAADQKLNEMFKKVKTKMSKEQVRLLIAAQKGWLQLRDNQCELEVFADRGTTGNEGQYFDCLTELTEQRIDQLKATPTDSTLE